MSRKGFHWSRAVCLLIGVATAIASWWAYYGVSELFGSEHSVFIAWALLISIVVHECGHWLAMELAGIRASIAMLVVLGGTFPIDAGSAARFKKVKWSTEILIALAGVLGNAVVIIAANLLAYRGTISEAHALAFTNLNAGLIFFNLLPFAMLDGNRFAKALFNSAPEWLDSTYVWILGGVAISGCVLVGLFVGKVFLFYPALMMIRLRGHAQEDDPKGSRSRRAMTRSQERVWMAAYLALFLGGVAASLMTTHWTKVL